MSGTCFRRPFFWSKFTTAFSNTKTVEILFLSHQKGEGWVLYQSDVLLTRIKTVLQAVEQFNGPGRLIR